nr:immunoglobulin heavy chain junction region [Macaca mulatta]
CPRLSSLYGLDSW